MREHKRQAPPPMRDEDIVTLSKRQTFWTWSAQDRVDPIAVDRAEGLALIDQALQVTDAAALGG